MVGNPWGQARSTLNLLPTTACTSPLHTLPPSLWVCPPHTLRPGPVAWKQRVSGTVAFTEQARTSSFFLILLFLLLLPPPTFCASSGSKSAQGKRVGRHQQLLQASFQGSASATQSCGLVQTVRAICLQSVWQKDHLSASDPCFPLTDYSGRLQACWEPPGVPACTGYPPKLTTPLQ